MPSSPFLSKADSVSRDVAVSLLIDLSGSMHGPRIILAQQCAVLLSETMDQLRFPLEIIGFTTTRDRGYLSELKKNGNESITEIEAQFARYVPLYHLIFKGFDEPLRRCRERFASMRPRHYTPLNESVLLAGKRLLKVKSSRRILLTLTDGSCYLGCKATQHVVQQNLKDNLSLLTKTGIEVIGIGIKAPYVKEVFHQSINVDELEELPVRFYQLISKQLIKTH